MSSPNRSRIRSEQPLITFGCESKSGSEFTIPNTCSQSVIRYRRKRKSNALGCARRLRQHEPELTQACFDPHERGAYSEGHAATRSEEHMSELQSHSFISYAVFC